MKPKRLVWYGGVEHPFIILSMEKRELTLQEANPEGDIDQEGPPSPPDSPVPDQEKQETLTVPATTGEEYC